MSGGAAVPPLYFGGKICQIHIDQTTPFSHTWQLSPVLPAHPTTPKGVSWEEKASGDPPCAKAPYPANPAEET